MSTTPTAITSRVIAKNERALKRESVTCSSDSETSSGARALIVLRSCSSSVLSHPGSARVAAGTAAFCTNGMRLMSVASPHASRAADTVRSTPNTVANSESNSTLSSATFVDPLA